MNIISFNKRERKLFLATIIICGFGLLYSFVYKPFITEYRKLDNEIKLNILELKQLQLLITQKEQIQSIYDNYKTKLRPAKSDSEEITNISQEITDIVEGAKLVLLEIKVLRVENAEYHKKYYIKVQMEGELVPVSSFIYDIQNSPQMLKVESLFLDFQTRNLNFRADMILTHIVSKEDKNEI